MADVDITLKNYRCFDDSRPAGVRLGKGMSAFIGPNNSGKSALLKMFFELRNVWSHFRERVEYLSSGRGDAAELGMIGLDDPSEIFCDGNTRGIEVELAVGQAYPTPESVPYLEKLKFSCQRGPQANAWRCEPVFNRSEEDVLADGSVMESILKDLQNAMYVGPFRNSTTDGAGYYYDISVGSACVDAYRAWKNGASKAHTRVMEAVTEDLRDLFGFRKLEINASVDGKAFQVLIDSRPYRLRELGAGLAHCIVVFINAAMRQPSYIFIDEPELNLHPSLQPHMLQKLSGYASEGLVFSTHSIGLARQLADRVYSFQPRRGCIAVKTLPEAMPSYAQLAGELGFGCMREVGCDQILLLENWSDVRTILPFLKLLGKERNVLLLPLGGLGTAMNMERELASLKKLAPKVAVFLDSERMAFSSPPSKERLDFETFCKHFDFQVCLSALRGIENYFPDAAIKAELGPKAQALGPFGSLKSAAWTKAQNWRIARRMSKSDLQGTDLGQFLEAL